MAGISANGTGRSFLVPAILVIGFIALVLAGPAGAAEITIDTSYSGGIAQAIADAGSDGTVILSPGTYNQYDISVANSVTIRAADGHSASDTIIDAQTYGRVFVDNGGYPLTINGLTLKNGSAAAGSSGYPGGDGSSGGAIISTGDVSVIASTIAGCSAGNGGSGTALDQAGSSGGRGGSGGAVYSTGNVSVIASTITGCSAGNGGGGGSAWNGAGNGGSGGSGGAIYSPGNVSIRSSTITGCRAGNGANGGSRYGGFGSAGEGGYGGAVYSTGTLSIQSSTITGCRAGNGANGGSNGAYGACSAGGNGGSGGAVYATGTVSVTSSTITGCSGGTGGAGGSGSYQGSTTCTRPGGSNGNGGAVWAGGSSAGTRAVTFCRLPGNHATGTSLYGGSALDATDNWWGSNSGPGSSDIGGSVTASPWLVLGISALPARIASTGTSLVTADLLSESDGTNLSATPGTTSLPEGIPVLFTTTSGSLAPASGYMHTGTFESTYTPSALGTGTIVATVDSQSVYVDVLTGTIGPVTSIVMDPSASAKLWTGIDNRGIYRSTNGGSIWTAATTQPANTHIRALAVSPADHTKLFAGTYGGGVYKSTDSGVTWSACSNSGLSSLNVLSLAANSTGLLYAGTDNGVYMSSDNCASWTAMNSGLS
ncbi:hypothetical protein [Methanoregula sp. UBA64]|uniref:hypothetical protein n=1 Tax=Methanoregula sp. UBA64 TaxID=1915554 RepID=UPI0025F7B425|nr:hypothetical protein [Methanoregula sp. UBA64]